jgi:polysaccharide export outer membrane protein
MFTRAIRIKFVATALCLAIIGLTNINIAGAEQPSAEQPAIGLLNVGDKINITVEGEDDLSGFYTINKAGMINVPLIGNILIAGKTTHEAKALIIKNLQDGYLLKPEVLVKEKPQTSDPTKVKKAPQEATEEETAAVLQESAKHARDYKKVQNHEQHGSKTKMFLKKKVYIVGAVQKPGKYTLPPEAGHILNIIALAGGYTDKADTSNFELIRNIDGKYYRKQAQTGALEYQDGDIIIIEKR